MTPIIHVQNTLERFYACAFLPLLHIAKLFSKVVLPICQFSSTII